MEPNNLLTRSIRNDSEVVYEGGSARIYWGVVPMGGKIQQPGKRCRRWAHDWTIDEYAGVRGTYRDRVCKKCDRRIPLN